MIETSRTRYLLRHLICQAIGQNNTWRNGSRRNTRLQEVSKLMARFSVVAYVCTLHTFSPAVSSQAFSTLIIKQIYVLFLNNSQRLREWYYLYWNIPKMCGLNIASNVCLIDVSLILKSYEIHLLIFYLYAKLLLVLNSLWSKV